MTRAQPSVYELTQQVEAYLRTVFELGQRVYTGHVPDTVPTTTSGHVYPYAALWPGAGTPVDDRDATGEPDPSGQRFVFTTTLVTADLGSLLQLIDRVKGVLLGAAVGNGVVWPDELQQDSAAPIADTNERPVRHYIPLRWHVQSQ